MAATEFSFVILTWNRYKFLEKCLAALVASLENPGACEVIVMDNGSTDKTPEVLAGWAASPLVNTIVRDRNYGLESYKKLLAAATGDYIVIVDDDVLEFPERLDRIFAEYMQAFPDYGFVAANVIQNQFTNGARPGPELYSDDTRDGRTIERGPTGGWCTCFRRSDYRKLRLRLLLTRFSMKSGEDGFIEGQFRKRLGLKSGIIRDAVCFHACGPYYAREYGHQDREIEKYTRSGLPSFAASFKEFREKK